MDTYQIINQFSHNFMKGEAWNKQTQFDLGPVWTFFALFNILTMCHPSTFVVPSG